MTKRKKAPAPEHTHLTIELTDFRASVDASINYEVNMPRHYRKDLKVFKFESHIEMEGICIYPEERTDEKFKLTIYGADSEHRDFELTLDDCHVRNDDGSRQYRKVRGKEIPVYDVPKGIGYHERQRGTKNWSGATWVSPQTVTDMLTL